MTSGVSLRQLRYVMTLAEELHFGRAAERLGIAQPALSQQLSALEAAIGCLLFTRRPRVALTPPGSAFVQEAAQVLGRLERGIEATRRVASGEVGPLTVGFAASAVLTDLPEIIRQYRAAYPGIILNLQELPAHREIEVIRSGEVDVAFVREFDSSPDIRYEVVLQESLGVLLPPQHPLVSSGEIAVRELEDQPFVHFPREIAPTLYDQIQSACRDAGFLPRVVQYVREWLTLIALVQSGFGVAIVPSSFHMLGWGGVSYRPLAGSVSRPTIALCYRSDNVSAAGEAFLDFARERADSRSKRRT